jgi:hypothetical protein
MRKIALSIALIIGSIASRAELLNIVQSGDLQKIIL